jgi:hypothetical protein
LGRSTVGSRGGGGRGGGGEASVESRRRAEAEAGSGEAQGRTRRAAKARERRRRAAREEAIAADLRRVRRNGEAVSKLVRIGGGRPSDRIVRRSGKHLTRVVHAVARVPRHAVSIVQHVSPFLEHLQWLGPINMEGWIAGLEDV